MAFAFQYLLLLSHFFILAALITSSSGKDVAGCSCGYFDHVTKELFTDSSIVYFNETTELPSDIFIPEVYENNYEKGWNSRFRQGADASNVVVANDQYASNTSLHLAIDPSTPQHLVVGGAVHTARRDVFYGSFRTLMRSPRAWIPGSALSMTLHFNDSQTINMDIMNPSEATAWVAMLSHEEFPDRALGVNYSVLSNSTNGISPWDYTEFRIDWTEEEVKYFIGGKLFRTILKSNAKSFPQTPTLLRLKHWSVGNWFTMQGPPTNRSVANVGWVRMFFNSSLTTEQDEENFDQRCSLESACATDDMSLRGFSAYKLASTITWQQAPNPRSSRTIPINILIVTGAISTFLIANALLRRIPRRGQKSSKLMEAADEKVEVPRYESSFGITSDAPIALPSALDSANESKGASYYGSRATSYYGGTDTPSRPTASSRNSLAPYIHIQMGATTPSEYGKDETKRPRISWREFSERIEQLQQDEATRYGEEPRGSFDYRESILNENTSEISSMYEDGGASKDMSYSDSDSVISTWPAGEAADVQVPSQARVQFGTNTTVITVESSASQELEALPSSANHCTCTAAEIYLATSNLRGEKTRIDSLAGLLSFSCLLVTVIQFSLTFSPASVDPGADVHYKTESWVRKTVSAYFLNLVWVGELFIPCTLRHRIRLLIMRLSRSLSDHIRAIPRVRFLGKWRPP